MELDKFKDLTCPHCGSKMTITKTLFHDTILGVCDNKDCGKVWQLGSDGQGKFFARGPFRKMKIG